MASSADSDFRDRFHRGDPDRREPLSPATSWRCTTAASSTDSCGSRWTTSTATTRRSSWPSVSRRCRRPVRRSPWSPPWPTRSTYAHQRGTAASRRQARQHPADDPGAGRTANSVVPTSGYGSATRQASPRLRRPEQSNGARFDGRADQYALAATAFHLLTGAPPVRPGDRPLGGRRPSSATSARSWPAWTASSPERWPTDPADRFGQLPRVRRGAHRAGRRLGSVITVPRPPSPPRSSTIPRTPGRRGARGRREPDADQRRPDARSNRAARSHSAAGRGARRTLLHEPTRAHGAGRAWF